MARGTSYRPNYGSDSRHPQGDRYAPIYQFGARDSDDISQGPPPPPPDFSFRSRPKLSERPLLQNRPHRGPDITLGSANREGAAAKFQKIEDLTDSEDEDMDVSDANDGKPIVLDQGPMPKWSSAEIYTSLPPPTDSRKSKDVVKLIRKARLEQKPINDLQSAVETNDDFISFSTDGIDQTMMDDAPANAPKGPRKGGLSPPQNRKRKRDEYLEQQLTAQPVFRRGKVAHRSGAILPEWQPKAAETPTPWFNEANGGSQNGIEHGLTTLHKEICDFYDWVKPRHFEHVMREDVIRRLHRCLQRLEPGSQLHAFGSFASGMYLPTGDMDLVLLTGPFLAAQATNRPPPPTRSINPYVKLIRNEGIARLGSVLPIPRAKVPIIKFVDNITGLQVDLSFNNTTGVDANHTYQQWKVQYPGMQQIATVVKHYLMIRGLGDVSIGGLGGFSLTCLVVSLLQLKPLAQQPLSLGSNLIEFFNLYGKRFNRFDLGIRVDFPGYFEKSSYAPFAHNNDKADRLAISDPNRPDNNISGGTSEIGVICECFSDAYEIVTEALEERNLGIGSNGSLLGDIIGGYYEAYRSQRDHLWRLFEKTISGNSSAFVQPPPPRQQKSTTESKSSPEKPKATPKKSALQISQPQRHKLPARPSNTIPETSGSTAPQADHPSSRSQQNPPKSNGSVSKAKQNSNVMNSTGAMSISSDDSETSPATSTGSKIPKGIRRANRLRELRPDISGIPKRLGSKQAIEISGYKSAKEMNEALQALEKRKKKAQK